MSHFIIALTITLVGYAVLGFSYLGIGWAGSLLFKINFPPKEKLFCFIWLGWAILLVLLQVASVFFPVNAFLSIPFLLLGTFFAGFLLLRRKGNCSFPLSRFFLIIVVAAGLWIAAQSMFYPDNYDSGLYHFNSIRWLNEYPMVLGLGNLHGRLAYNQSFFTYAAYLNFYPLFPHGYTLANGFLFFILVAECFWSLSESVFHSSGFSEFKPSHVVAFSCIPIILFMVAHSNISSPTPDLASSILQILLVIQFSRFLEEAGSGQSDTARIFYLFILSAIAITVKLSNGFFVLTICLILAVIRWKDRRESLRDKLVDLGRLAAIPILILAIWSVRGILFSGCPAYPSTEGCVNAGWSVPVESVKSEADWIYSWARMPGSTPDKVLASWSWVAPWIQERISRDQTTVLLPLAVSLVFALACILLLLGVPSARKVNPFAYLLPVPVISGLIFWFFSAPDVRFANALFWILPVSLGFVLIRMLEASGSVQPGRIAYFFLFLGGLTLAWMVFKDPHPFLRISKTGFEPIPMGQLTIQRTNAGLEILTPIQDDRCWDSKIPCTPMFNDQLIFIDNGLFPEFTVHSKK
jgi:hypothetical protein